MNLYDLHTNPKSLKHHDVADKKVAAIIWAKFMDGMYTAREMLEFRPAFANPHTDPLLMVQYASRFLPLNNKRFEEAEHIIAKNPRAAYLYALNIMDGRWPEGERAIVKSPQWALNYANRVIGGRWPECEDTIAKHATFSYLYATSVLDNKPFKKGEPAIAADALKAVAYAKNVLGGSFKLAEPVIAKNGMMAYEYAVDALNERFPEGEDAMRQNPNVWARYKHYFGIKE